MANDLGMETVDSIVQALYRSITFEAEQQPDWDGLRALFLAGARITNAQYAENKGIPGLDVETFIDRTRHFLESRGVVEMGFRETEVMRKTESFGRITHVFSTYESFLGDAPDRPFARGTNSMQLLNKKGRWWLVSLLYDEGDLAKSAGASSTAD